MIETLVEKPLILLTTSRSPTRDTRTFCRDLSNTFPNTVRINRGKLSLDGVAEKALELQTEKAVIICKWRGGSAKIQLLRVGENGLNAIPPLIYVKNIMLRRDFAEKVLRRRRVNSVVITASQTISSEAKRLEDVFSQFFNIPILSPNETRNGKYDATMQISANSSNHIVITFKLTPELVEVGPHITISHLVWELTS
ncbi:hypothetical protein KAT21_01230 [Candidatus Bathyarchaeota archaeon]|nr:hypothetical protein [Candidatus Bathyarchaeota archaeon]